MERSRASAAIASFLLAIGVGSAASAQTVLEIDYDAIGRVAVVRDGENHASTFLPAGLGYGGYRDARGGAVQIVYDTDDRAVTQTDELGRTSRSTYDMRGRVKTRTNPENDRIEFGYDGKNNVISLQRFAKPGSAEAGQTQTITATYDLTWNKPATIADARNGVTSFTYVPAGSAGAGELATQTLPTTASGTATYSFSYNSLGQVLTSTDPTNLVVQSTYASSVGRYLSTLSLDPSGVATTLTFTTNAAGDITGIDGARAGSADVWSTTYDAARRKLLEAAPDTGNGQRVASLTAYTPRGFVDKVERGYLAGATFTALETESYVYDNAGNKTRTTTPAGITQVDYDELNRVTCTAVRMNPAVYGSLPSSACSMTATGSFGPDQITRNGYDAAGQLTSIEMGVGAAEKAFYARYLYTLNGKRSAVIDGNSNRTGLAYDGFDRLKQMRFPHKTQVDTVSTDDYEEYGYDANGNRTSWRRRDGQTITFQYDALNRMAVKDLPGGTAQDVFYAYDRASRMTEARFASTSGQGVITTYDTAGRKATETTFGRQIASLYDAANNRTRVTWPDGVYATYEYDASYRLTAIKENGANTLVSVGYGALDRRSQLTRANGTQTNYGYDTAGRLTNLAHVVATSGQSSYQTASYSPASQVASLNQANAAYVWAGQPSVEKTYTHDGLNRISTLAALSGGYDARGNLTHDGQRTFTYDVENKLTTASGGGAPMSLAYDPTGRLYETSVSGAVTRMLYDGDKLVGEYDGVSNALLRRYVHGIGTDEPFVWYQGSGVSDRRFLHTDRQGSVISWTNASGGPTIYTYGPYGEPQDWQGSRFRYTGQISLPEAQLYHYKARVYDPTVGRFLQTDPVGYEADLNLYAYVRGDPVNLSDPDGRNPMAGAVAGCAVTGPACPAGATVGAVIGGVAAIGGAACAANDGCRSAVGDFIRGIFRNDEAHPLPDQPVGDSPKPDRTGGRLVSGPMKPEHGGTGDAGKDFDKLTGGKHGPNTDSGRPEGTRVGTNGVQVRPGPKGPRIDIPQNGDKPKETLHYPPPPPPPPPPKPDGF